MSTASEDSCNGLFGVKLYENDKLMMMIICITTTVLHIVLNPRTCFDCAECSKPHEIHLVGDQNHRTCSNICNDSSHVVRHMVGFIQAGS